MSSLQESRWKTASWTAALTLTLAAASLARLAVRSDRLQPVDVQVRSDRLQPVKGGSERFDRASHINRPAEAGHYEPLLPVVAPKPVPRKTAKSNHPPQNEMLRRLAARLHDEALAHFYSDPRNGLYRLPVVYERIVRKWTSPYFSPGELGTDEPIPHRDDLRKIHRSSLSDFTTLRPPTTTIADLRKAGLWKIDRKKFDKNRKVWEVKQLDLVGLVLHAEPVAYVSEKLPAMDKLHAVPTRELDEFEYSGLSVLENGKDLYARGDKGVIRLLGAVRAKTSCLSCHTKHKSGDLLGAFSYTLREAQYKRDFKRFGPRRRLETLKALNTLKGRK
jgi:hypothetical protein